MFMDLFFTRILFSSSIDSFMFMDLFFTRILLLVALLTALCLWRWTSFLHVFYLVALSFIFFISYAFNAVLYTLCTETGMKLSMIWYEIEYFSFLIIAVLFSAGNAKKNVFTVFIDPIVTIDVLVRHSASGIVYE